MDKIKIMAEMYGNPYHYFDIASTWYNFHIPTPLAPGFCWNDSKLTFQNVTKIAKKRPDWSGGGGDARTRDENFLRGGGAGWRMVSLCAERGGMKLQFC